MEQIKLNNKNQYIKMNQLELITLKNSIDAIGEKIVKQLKFTSIKQINGYMKALENRLKKTNLNDMSTYLELCKFYQEKGVNTDDILELINLLSNSYGIESITHEDCWISHYYQNIIGLYINRGDTYDETIVYDTKNNKFEAISWGSFYEYYK